MRSSSSSRRRKQGSLTHGRDDVYAMGGSPAMTPTDMNSDHGVVSRHQDFLGPHRRRRQEPAVCITNQTAYTNATVVAGGARGSTSDDEEPGPVTSTTKTVREVQIGPGITLGYLSSKDYRFITSLSVVEEQQQH